MTTRRDDGADETQPIDFDCPRCGAPAGQGCVARTPWRRRSPAQRSHLSRRRLSAVDATVKTKAFHRPPCVDGDHCGEPSGCPPLNCGHLFHQKHDVPWGVQWYGWTGLSWDFDEVMCPPSVRGNA